MDNNTYRDLYKAAYGFRPAINNPFFTATGWRRKKIWDDTFELFLKEEKRREIEKEICLLEMEREINDYIEGGLAQTRAEALRNIVYVANGREETIDFLEGNRPSKYDIGFYLWQKGIMNSELEDEIYESYGE